MRKQIGIFGGSGSNPKYETAWGTKSPLQDRITPCLCTLKPKEPLNGSPDLCIYERGGGGVANDDVDRVAQDCRVLFRIRPWMESINSQESRMLGRIVHYSRKNQ